MSGVVAPPGAPAPPADSAHDTRRGSTVSLPGTAQGAARRRASITSLLGESSAGLLARAPPPPARARAGTSAGAASAASGARGDDAWYIRTRTPAEAPDDDAAASFPAWLEQRAAAAATEPQPEGHSAHACAKAHAQAAAATARLAREAAAAQAVRKRQLASGCAQRRPRPSER